MMHRTRCGFAEMARRPLSLQRLVRAGYGGVAVDLQRLADASVPLAELVD